MSRIARSSGGQLSVVLSSEYGELTMPIASPRTPIESEMIFIMLIDCGQKMESR